MASRLWTCRETIFARSLYKHFGTLFYGIATYTKLMLRNSSRANRIEPFKSITTTTTATTTTTFKSEETHEPKYY